MEYRGRVKDGVIVLEGGAVLAEGSVVAVHPLPQGTSEGDGGNEQPLGQKLMKFAGKAQGLPRDAARNHDHDLYGSPKR